METIDFYNDNLPKLLSRLSNTPEMQRLKRVGMNCGCEYTAFERFRDLSPYSRFTHSLGAGLITWHFTKSPAAAAAALLHDIATPVFAHTVDFLNGDYLVQESTESRTAELISSSAEICAILSDYGLKPEDVWDYHRYPIADNDSPKLSADRLEYTFGNGVNFGFMTQGEAQEIYSAIIVGQNEFGENELCFSDLSAAERFAFLALDCSKVYVSDEDRYSMQILSEILRDALALKVISFDELNRDEPAVISKLLSDETTKTKWKDFRSLSKMISADEYPYAARTIPAKKRRIDPLVAGHGRVSELSKEFRYALDVFLRCDFSIPVAGE